MRELLVTSQFEKDCRSLPVFVRQHADGVIVRLRTNPLDASLNLRKLKEIGDDLWRVRVGNYRLVYSFSETSLILYRLRHRKDVYRNL